MKDYTLRKVIKMKMKKILNLMMDQKIVKTDMAIQMNMVLLLIRNDFNSLNNLKFQMF